MIQKKEQILRILAQLSATEKAYFKKFAYKISVAKNDVMLMFDMLEAELKKEGEQFDLPRFKKKFKTKSKADFVKTKSRLLELLLNSLKEYDSTNSLVSELFSLIEISDSLAKRNLFHDAYAILEKALKLSVDLEHPEIELFILNKVELLNTYVKKYDLKGMQEASINSSKLKLEKLKEKYESDWASFKVLHFQKVYGTPKTKEEWTEFKKLLNTKYFSSDAKTSFYTSEIDRTIAKSGLNFMQGDVLKVIEEAQELLEQIDLNSKLFKKLLGRVLSLYDSFLQACLLSLNIPLYEQHYPKFSSIESNVVREIFLKKAIDLYLRSMYAILADKESSLSDLQKEFAQISEEDYVPNYRKISIAYYLMFGNFLFDKASIAQDYILWLRNHKHYGIRDDIESAYLAIELLILWEAQEFDLLSYKLRAYADYLKVRDTAMSIELEFLAFMKQLVKTIDPSEQKLLKQDYLANFKQLLLEDPKNGIFVSSFDIISWLESKLEKESFKEVYYRRNGIKT